MDVARVQRVAWIDERPIATCIVGCDAREQRIIAIHVLRRWRILRHHFAFEHGGIVLDALRGDGFKAGAAMSVERSAAVLRSAKKVDHCKLIRRAGVEVRHPLYRTQPIRFGRRDRERAEDDSRSAVCGQREAFSKLIAIPRAKILRVLRRCSLASARIEISWRRSKRLAAFRVGNQRLWIDSEILHDSDRPLFPTDGMHRKRGAWVQSKHWFLRCTSE